MSSWPARPRRTHRADNIATGALGRSTGPTVWHVRILSIGWGIAFAQTRSPRAARRLLLRDVLVVNRSVKELLYDAEAAISRSIAARCSGLSTTNSTPATHMISGLPVTAIVWTT